MNVITIAGNLTKDSELRDSKGLRFLSFSIAAILDNRDEKPRYFDCTLWGKRGESLAPYLKKGNKVVVTGRFGISPWKDRNGADRETFTVSVSDIELMSAREHC